MARGPTQQQRARLQELLKRHTAEIRAAFLQALRSARALIDYDALLSAVEQYDWLRVASLMQLDEAALWPLQEAIRAAFIATGIAVANTAGARGAFTFSGRHLRAEQIIAATGARLVREVGSPGTEAIRAILLEGQRHGYGVKRIAQQLAGIVDPETGLPRGGILGLDAMRAKRAASLRAILVDPARLPEYFDGTRPRYLHTNRAYDEEVRAAISSGRGLSAASAERIARDYEARLLEDRAITIATTEAYQAQAQGRYEAYRQMLERGIAEAISKEWRHATLRHPRPDHKALDGAVRDFEEPFIMADGTRMQYPHDPSAGADHRIGCRCSVIYRPRFRRV